MTKVLLPHSILMQDGEWFSWCEDNIGLNNEGWGWTDEPQGHFVYFRHEEDAVAFKIRFGL